MMRHILFYMCMVFGVTHSGTLHADDQLTTGASNGISGQWSSIDSIEGFDQYVQKFEESIQKLEGDVSGKSDVYPIKQQAEFSCQERVEFLKTKLEQAISPTDLLQKLAGGNQQILIFGNKHNMDEHQNWYNEFVNRYRKARPGGVDCIFSEDNADPLVYDLFSSGPAYLKKYGTIKEAIQHYVADRGLSVEYRNPTIPIIKNPRAKIRSGAVAPVGLYQVVQWFDLKTLEDYFRSGIKFIYIDSRYTVSRDQFISAYIKELFESGTCHSAVANLGIGHLRAQKAFLQEKGISAYTIAMRNLNPSFRDVPLVASLIEEKGALDAPNCPFPKAMTPKHPVVIFSSETNSPTSGPFDFRWNEIDAHILGPVLKKYEGDYWKKMPGIF